MLTHLSIRDVVLIERLELRFGAGLTVLTGETGAGKSILLDSLGLALGMRSEQGLVRHGAPSAAVSASFSLEDSHPAWRLLEEQDIPREDHLLLRRQIGTDGRSRAFVNDQQVGVAFLRRLGETLVEIQGQHEQQGLADQATHTGLLDAFGVPPARVAAVREAWQSWRHIREALEQARARLERAAREEDWLRHAVDELAKLAPVAGEETALAQTRQALQAAERRAEAIASAQSELTPRERRAANPATALRAAARALGKLVTETDQTAAPALAALERAEDAVMEAEQAIARLADLAEPNPRLLEATEERLFALRAAARKYQIAMVDLPGLLESLRTRLAALDQGVAGLARLETEEARAALLYRTAAAELTAARREAAGFLEAAVMTELPPLRLEKARFIVEVTALPADRGGPAGLDLVRFLIAANPGLPPGPLDRVASGGELSRLMLALNVVLARASHLHRNELAVRIIPIQKPHRLPVPVEPPRSRHPSPGQASRRPRRTVLFRPVRRAVARQRAQGRSHQHQTKHLPRRYRPAAFGRSDDQRDLAAEEPQYASRNIPLHRSDRLPQTLGRDAYVPTPAGRHADRRRQLHGSDEFQ